MVDFLKIAKTRKTTYEFTSKKVDDVHIARILEAGRWAPSCSNVQPWHFIIIKDKEQIKKMIDTASYGGFHTDPPLLIACILDFGCWKSSEHRCVKNDKLGTIEAYLSIAMPALSMIFEATALGIQSCILTPEQNTSSKILRLNKGDQTPIIIGFGYEKTGSFQKNRTRKEIKELISYDHFGGKLNAKK